MKSRTRHTLLAALLLTGSMTLTACTQSKVEGPSASDRRFQSSLVAATDAIHAGDLNAARAQLVLAEEDAHTQLQLSKLDSLDHLLTGAEALMRGDVDLARMQWSLIADPILRREVAYRASELGFELEPAPALTQR